MLFEEIVGDFPELTLQDIWIGWMFTADRGMSWLFDQDLSDLASG